MPADYEMLVSHSPPVYNSYLTDYTSHRYNNRDVINSFASRNCRSASANSLFMPVKVNIHFPTPPRRPCLVIRPSEENSSSDEDPTSPTRLKKKVVFADDRGMSLTHVRVMTEPSNVPPLLNSRFLAEVTRGLSAEPIAKIDPWELEFAQPASDYLEFRRKLDLDKVSLENVIIKESDNQAVGTIKVSNISFQKEVIVRSSSDDWKTYEDTFCKFVSNGPPNNISAAYVLYDTFSFQLTLPLKLRKIEFCICYRCNGEEYWDNNYNKNFVLLKKRPYEILTKSLSSTDLLNITANSNIQKTPAVQCADATRAKVEAWSEFASWNHLENSSPYW